MAYMRGSTYIWNDGENIHINDFFIPGKIMDEYVVMRFAEMTKSTITRAEKRALKKHLGNFGCDGVAKKHGETTCVEQLKSGVKRKK